MFRNRIISAFPVGHQNVEENSAFHAALFWVLLSNKKVAVTVQVRGT